MNDLEDLPAQVAAWLQPLPDADAPCGPDLEYDNEFLALTQAAAGKPESQFGPAQPPDWRTAAETAESLFGRTRDLRVAIVWLRAQVSLLGYAAFPAGLELLTGLIEQHWDRLHPLPDPDDGDPYARVNALSVLVDAQGLVANLREARISDDRALAGLTLRPFEVALGLAPLRSDETETGRDSLARMLAAAVESSPALRGICTDAAARVQRLISLVGEKLGASVAPDLRLLAKWTAGVAGLLPPEPGTEAAAGGEPGAGAGAGSAGRPGLSGGVSSRDEAIRAIDMVCEYLERAEPTNPAPLFLRRARALIGHNFLQLMKALAPDALADVARAVGIDPDSVEEPGGS
ncbi:MAG: type VI secretion system ImpA family N-terminal domain-containing protein [Burkholderiales bacterium]|nr:type VI secretion system ImpA family N-terminal domain-containing protein [Burkholderiales bacterium]MDE2564285.1 type VI secretion system ImpA family N-terminal domain-containing protein [Burkholderiales bacterium]